MPERTTPAPLRERGGPTLQWPVLRAHLADGAQSPPARDLLATLEPTADRNWIATQQSRTADMRLYIAGSGTASGFDFRALFLPDELLDKARIEGAALSPAELLATLALAERITAWRNTMLAPPDRVRGRWSAIEALSAPLLDHDLAALLRFLRGKIEADGTLADDASPELARIRRAQVRQHKAIEASLRRALSKITEADTSDGQAALITVRGDRFVIPVRAELKRKVPGVVQGSSSTGQTIFIEPLETIDENNELVRLLDEEQSEIHRILVALTRAVAGQAVALTLGAEILIQLDAHQTIARFAEDFNCVRPAFTDELRLEEARHPLLELRLRATPETRVAHASHSHRDAWRTPGARTSIVPLTLALEPTRRQLIISGPNTGGKTVALKTAGLLAIMAQAGLPVPAAKATLPLFTAFYADIGDSQSIDNNLSTFSAHITNIDHIARVADRDSLVLLDELGSATDPEEGAALAVAVAQHFLERGSWSIITTHLNALKIYATREDGVLNAAVGFDQATLAPTYDLRLGVPGASAGLNIAARLGLDPAIVAAARANMSAEALDIGRFLEELHAQLAAATADRAALAERERAVAAERVRLETEGRAEQKQRTRELAGKLEALLAEFQAQIQTTVKAIGDKTLAQKIARDAAVRMASLRREASAQFDATVVAHHTGADRDDAPAKPTQREPRVGDTVTLKSLNREARVAKILDSKTLEVTMGSMKMRIPRTDIVLVHAANTVTTPKPKRTGGGVTVSTSLDSDTLTSEINVIGRTADEAEAEVERFLEHAFLAGLPSIRIVHGVGMGILRRALREMLKKHPHVTAITEPPYNEGGQGATLVELRQ